MDRRPHPKAAITPSPLTSPTSTTRQREPEIAARHRIKPLRQGELDFLCGLYAPINAIRLALADCAPLSSKAYKGLFAKGVRYLDRKGGLHQSLTWGMNLRRRYALACHLAELVSDENVRVSIERADFRNWRSIDDAFAWIEQSLAADQPVLVYFAEMPDHYTVIAGSAPTRLHLFDSAGTGFVYKASCDLRAGTHIMQPKGLLRVVVETTGQSLILPAAGKER